MLEMSEILKILELIISVCGLLLVIVGFIVPFKQSLELNKINVKDKLEQEKRVWRMQLLDEQISKYYGPIAALLKEQSVIRQRVFYQIGKDAIFSDEKERLSDLPEDVQLIWKHFIDNYRMPIQNEILKIMRENTHLAIHGEHDIYVDKFLDYALGWELLDNQKKEGVPNFYEYHYCYNYPVGFNNYINNTLTTLLREKELLLKSN